VPAGEVREDEHEQFCCGGCRAVYHAIHSCGLEEYYALRERMESGETPAKLADSSFAELDDPAFQASACVRDASGAMSCELLVEGVHCAACMWLIENLTRVVPGLVSARLDFTRSLVRVAWDPERTRLSAIATAMARFGYVAHPARAGEARAARRRQDRDALIRIGVAGACAGNVMLLAFALYSGEFATIEEPFLTIFRVLSMLLGVLAIAWPGSVFFRGAFAAIRTRTWHLDMPVALALGVGTIVGVVNTLRGEGHLYFDSLTMLVFLLLGGRWLQLRQQRQATDSVELLFSLTPRRAHRVNDAGMIEDVAVDALERGDILEIACNESFPVDGIVLVGASTADASVLTGESRPVPIAQGDEVAAGSVNLSGVVRVRASAVGRDTRVGRMMALIEEMSRRRVPVIGSADRIAGPFVLAVFLLAGLTLALHAHEGLPAAFEHAVALLVVCCPCAAALATPLATSAAIGRAARRGILIKGGDVLESLSRPGEIVLDKTGTLTEGRFDLREWIGDESMRSVVATMERGASHPIAAALAHAGDAHVDLERIEHVPGSGMLANLAGERIAVGSEVFMRELGVTLEAPLAERVCAASASALTPVLIARGSRVVAAAMLGDALRPGVRDTLDALRARGWATTLLSGDDPGPVSACAEACGFAPDAAHARVTPEGKREYIAQRAESGRVVMVGDGVNDAAALASASVGIAVRGGAEASLAAADVYMRHDDASLLVELVDSSKRAVRAIRRCLAIAIGYNAIAAALAVAGLITPLAAAVIMPISSLTVIALALRARTFGGES
jgi:Cu2+-exporting ATPase